LKIKDQRPKSWTDFKYQLTSQFQLVNFQENLRQQLLQLRQKNSLQDYVYKFRSYCRSNSCSGWTHIQLTLVYKEYRAAGRENFIQYLRQ
jgi:hypothetical protein